MPPQTTIREISRTPSPFATSVPADVMTITFTNNSSLRIFVKYISRKQSDHPEKKVREREILVYENLFANTDLPVVGYFGTRSNRNEECYELYLEYVDDWNLKYQALDYWFLAAQRIARLHAYFAIRSDLLLQSGYLLQLDRNYFRGWARRAVDAVSRNAGEWIPQLRYVVDNYDVVIDLLVSQRPTLVHNDLAPKNVIAVRSQSPVRICIVDWEMAAVGCGLLDLVHLTNGLDSESGRKMRSAYCDELCGTGLLPSNTQELDNLFAACELHKTVYRLAFSDTWNLPRELIVKWVQDASELLRRSGGVDLEKSRVITIAPAVTP